MNGKPRTDEAKFYELEAAYIGGDKSALGDMYTILYTLAYKFINKSARGQSFCTADREQKAHDAATYLIEQYIKREGFRINDSVSGYLHCRINHELNYARNCDKMLVFTGELPELRSDKKAYEYIVTDTATGTRTTYHSAGELYLNPVFRGLRKKRLVECIKTGRRWKRYKFDLLEVWKANASDFERTRAKKSDLKRNETKRSDND